MKSINVNNLANEVINELEKYKLTTTESIKKSVIDVGDFVKKEISTNAPKNTGKYAKGWKKKITNETGDSISVTIYNPKNYQLSHLLEFGHAKRNGGRIKAMPHIKPAEIEGINKLEKEIIKELKNG